MVDESVRLAVVATHPIQYYAPLFRQLAKREALALHVFYGWTGATGAGTFDPGFGQEVRWDVPLLEGYVHEFIPNRSPDPGTHHFGGLDNPDLVPRVLAWKPDAVLIFGWAWKSHLRALHELYGRVPVLFRGDSTLLDERPGARRIIRRTWLRWVYQHVDLALYVGTHNRAYFRSHGLDDDRLRWAPHAVENSRFFDPDGQHAEEARSWRARLGIPGEARTILFAGKLEPKKSPETLLNAFLVSQDRSAHLIFAGSGPLEGRLQARAAGRRNVHFIGFQNQSRMPVVYRLGDFFVLPSRSETWGLAVNEAMACGRPVVVSDRVGCAPDLVREGKTGHVVPVGQVEALRSTLARLLDETSYCAEMGSAAARLIKDWGIERQAACMEAVVLGLGHA